MTTAPVDVRPRRAGDPVPDLRAVRLAHRVLLRDAARLTDLAERAAAGTTTVDDRRAAAVTGYVRGWADAVHVHCRAEDELLWPVLAASAGPHLDLSELVDDHAALDPALDRVRRVADRFAARTDEDTATALAVELAELRDVLVEHVGDEEGAVLPALERYVSVRDWQRVQVQTACRTSLRVELPRAYGLLDRSDRRGAGLLLTVGARVLRPGFRRRERLVFGVSRGAGAGRA